MKSPSRKFRNPGFALVVTLSLMILLTVIAVGLLSLSSITLRSAGQGAAASMARGNARLAMMLALGELQASLGQDTSVSAPAAAVISGPPRPHLTGVWQRPAATGDFGKWHWTPVAGSKPNYTDKAGLFSRWLVSSPNPSDSTNFNLPSTKIDAGAEVVTLVGNPLPAKDLKNNGISTLVNASKVKVGRPNQLGKYAWSVSDESTKAAIELGNPKTNQTEGQEIASRSAASRFRADILDTALETSLKNPQNLISLETAVIPGGAASQVEFRKRIHDFTTSSMGLLTDTANGGLKTDLTPLFEDGGTNFPTGAFDAPNTISPYAYPPANPAAASAGAVSWKYLRDHYRKYKTVTKTGAELVYKPKNNSDLVINKTGLSPSPEVERLLPVIAKFQLVFSVVTHYSYLKERRDWLNASAVPKGYANFGVPDIVYDPVITLYNPYDVTLDLNRVRIRIWDPPVGFRFKKVDNQKGTSVYFRPGDTDKDGVRFRGLANFKFGQETSDTVRKCFTLILTNGTNAASGTKLKLLPGEVKVYSPRVEDNWNWELEAGNGSTNSYPVRSFFDWGNNNFANIDGRTANGIGQFGIETVPGWQSHAGLQTDHLSNGARDATTLYDYEKSSPNGVGGFVNMRLTDDLVVEAKPVVTKGNATKSFQVDVLAGITQGQVTNADGDANNKGVDVDTLRSYSFNFANATDPSAEINASKDTPFISRQFNVLDILQGPKDKSGKKKPFAMLEMSARTTRDDQTDNKPWLYNNPIVDGAVQTSSAVGLANQSYDLRFMEMTSFTGFPKGIDVDPTTNRGYFGATGSSQLGSSFVQMMRVPIAPAASLGDLIHANLVGGSQLPRVVHPFGNARAHPLIPSNGISKTISGVGTLLDHSYLLNDGLWDKYFFSSVTDYGAPMLDTSSRSEVLSGVFDGTVPALNTRLVPVTSAGDPKALAQKVNNLTIVPFSRQIAKHVAITGPFNLNSTSVDAWRAVLSSLRDRAINGAQPSGTAAAPTVTLTKFPNDDKTPFTRMGKPLADSTATGNIRWAGYRSLTDTQIETLARSIVTEISKRGVKDRAPAFSMGEFVNRRLGEADEVHLLAGLLQTAIDNTDINQASIALDSKPTQLDVASVADVRKKGVEPSTSKTMDGNSSEGAPSMLTQGDLMGALAPISTVRGDTFKIRAYGEATATNGTTVTASAWCEAVVQRVPDFVDPVDAPETAIASLSSNANKLFGRRFNIVSFRWLSKEEL